jgi:orotate phosphoribosyltransferase
MLDREFVLDMFRRSGALLEGHFQLTSGLHSNQYFQCARVLQYPEYAEALCGDIAEAFRGGVIDAVIAPAIGGIVVAQETGRQLRVRTMFAERKEGAMELRRGFTLKPGERVLVCEDVVTTGGSVQEVIDIVRRFGGKVAGVGYIVDRSNGSVRFAMDDRSKQHPVLTMDVVAYAPEQCPLCAQGSKPVKPGSRGNY